MNSSFDTAATLRAIPVSRRETLAVGLAAGMSLAASSIPTPASAAATSPGAAQEGYFLVYEKSGADFDSRIFFISSEWLQLFEVTDVYRNYYKGSIDPGAIVAKIRQGQTNGSGRIKKFLAMYCDNGDILEPILGASVIQPTPPQPTQTYFAMMISDAYQVPADEAS